MNFQKFIDVQRDSVTTTRLDLGGDLAKEKGESQHVTLYYRSEAMILEISCLEWVLVA